MGSSETKPIEPSVTHAQVVSIINASNAKNKEHAERTSVSTELIAYTLIAIVIIGLIYLTYRLITNYERMRTQARMNNAISLNNITQHKVSEV